MILKILVDLFLRIRILLMYTLPFIVFIVIIIYYFLNGHLEIVVIIISLL